LEKSNYIWVVTSLEQNIVHPSCRYECRSFGPLPAFDLRKIDGIVGLKVEGFATYLDTLVH